VIIALAPAKTDDEARKSLRSQKGDRVLISKYGGTEIKLEARSTNY